MDKLSDEQQKRMAEAGRAALNMAHGIKNIAQSMRSGGEVMDTALETGDLDIAKRTWPILRQSLGRIEKLALDMLTFSADHPPDLQRCDLNRLVESVVQRLRPQAGQRQVTLSAEVAEGLPQVPMDAEQMTDVVMNLLINAIEAVEADTGTVTVRTELDAAANQVVLSIRDNGGGIENPDTIFEPFYTTKSNLGAGLGLAIARKIVENHAGTIEVQSTPGEETVFTVRIPC
ncbi:MAG: two-component system sensor histidine kinase NtrB [Planctomycetota bacterium]|jgi:signal transduction histidine kinase